MIENYQIRDAIVAASKHDRHPQGELTEQLAAIFCGLRLGLEEVGLMEYDEKDSLYNAIIAADQGWRVNCK